MRKFIKRCFFFCVFLGFIGIGVSILYVKLSPSLNINSTNSIQLVDNNNLVFFKGNESKEWVSLDYISDDLINATISTEDKNFYKHFGFDLLRIIKASYINIINRDTIQGASTISQQYAKNLFLEFDKTWKRKWDEMWYTLRIEDDYSKDEILEGYLNTINYGHGKYGIENASKYYFNKTASELSLAEASILVGIPKAPSNYSPLINYDLSKRRQRVVLNTMVNNGYITQEEADFAFDQELIFTKTNSKDEVTSLMYYKDAVLDELENINSIPKNYNEMTGLKIYTNLDYNAQKKLEDSISDSLGNSNLEVSSVMIKPETGGIIALIGGKNYEVSSYNRATDSLRQVGSTMKPFLYYSALENGFTSSSAFTSEETTFSFATGDDYSPKNYNNKYGNRPISMAAAIAYSENIYAVKTHLFLGGESLINTARRVGITAKLENIPSLPLGTNEINIIEMVSGYASFANLGYKIKPHLIEKIEDMDGNVLYECNHNKELVLNPSLVFILNNMLTCTYNTNFIDYNYPTAVNLANKLTHTYAIKSGTTNTDNWYIGYNKDVVTGVWVGYDDNRNINSTEYKYAQNIWFNATEEYMVGKDNKAVWYDVPNNVSGVFVDPISGKPVTDDKSKKVLMYFLKGTEPNASDPVFDEIYSNEVGT